MGAVRTFFRKLLERIYGEWSQEQREYAEQVLLSIFGIQEGVREE
ncbi:MAG: hypothetical protein ACTSQI_20280 [Candidatus Helarchaeota archaeon]